jgi:nitrate reductase gamma subunit
MHYKIQADIVFYTIAGIATLLLLLGLAGMVHLWMLGKEKPLGTEIKVSKWITAILKAGILQTQILEYSTLAWLAHMMIFWGFMFLLLLTSFHFVLIWIIPSSSSFFHYFKAGGGNFFLAFWGDFWGLTLFIGILLALFRRYILRPETQNTISDDSIAIWSLFVLTITGFMCEAVRLAARPEAQDAAYSFAVHWMVPLLRRYNWAEVHITYLFWIHAIVSFIFIVYIPFSKFRHIFSSPLDYAFVTASNRYTKEDWVKRR